MKQRLKAYLANVGSTIKAFPTGMTDQNEFCSLLKRLYPLSTNKELIRLGPKGDGGYLIPNDLEGIQACFSPGVNLVSGFEKDCAGLGMKVFLADKSVDQPADDHKLFNFTKKYIGAITNEDFMTLDSWVDASIPSSDSDLLLQIDIEGYEYEVFLSVSEALLRRFRIIVAEFHSLDQFWSKPFFNVASSAFNKILQTHKCVHIHPNNVAGTLTNNGIIVPKVMEFTFLRNDRIESSSFQKNYPNPLDYDNTTKPSLVLPKCWHGE